MISSQALEQIFTLAVFWYLNASLQGSRIFVIHVVVHASVSTDVHTSTIQGRIFGGGGFRLKPHIEVRFK